MSYAVFVARVVSGGEWAGGVIVIVLAVRCRVVGEGLEVRIWGGGLVDTVAVWKCTVCAAIEDTSDIIRHDRILGGACGVDATMEMVFMVFLRCIKPCGALWGFIREMAFDGTNIALPVVVE